MVTLKKLLQFSKDHRTKMSAADIMILKRELPIIGLDETAEMAHIQMTRPRSEKSLFVTVKGKLIGMVSKRTC